MKTPRDVADGTKGRKINETIREIIIVPRLEARKRIKQLFEEFPSAKAGEYFGAARLS